MARYGNEQSGSISKTVDWWVPERTVGPRGIVFSSQTDGAAPMQLFVDPHAAPRTRRHRRRSMAKATAFSLAALLLANQGLAQISDRGQLDAPTPPLALAIGSPSRGCLAGGEALPLDGPGWQVMRPSRHRYFGHSQLIAFIESLASDVNRMGGSILVGDMALPRGGPMPTGHRSHQIGLDVDIWFEPAPPPPFAPLDREEV